MSYMSLREEDSFQVQKSKKHGNRKYRRQSTADSQPEKAHSDPKSIIPSGKSAISVYQNQKLWEPLLISKLKSFQKRLRKIQLWLTKTWIWFLVFMQTSPLKFSLRLRSFRTFLKYFVYVIFWLLFAQKSEGIRLKNTAAKYLVYGRFG